MSSWSLKGFAGMIDNERCLHVKANLYAHQEGFLNSVYTPNWFYQSSWFLLRDGWRRFKSPLFLLQPYFFCKAKKGVDL